MDFLPEALTDYVERHSQDENELLKKINRETHLHVLRPRMLSGHLQGRVLSVLSKMIQPKAILEIGTYTGYSALCLAEGLARTGSITTIDINEELHERVSDYFRESAYSDQIDYRIGNAIDIIPELTGDWDMVFIDADKRNYGSYYELIIDKVNHGGYILVDNVLWSGKVVDQENGLDVDTVAINEFNQMVTNDPRTENVLFPIRDGLMIIRKI